MKSIDCQHYMAKYNCFLYFATKFYWTLPTSLVFLFEQLQFNEHTSVTSSTLTLIWKSIGNQIVWVSIACKIYQFLYLNSQHAIKNNWSLSFVINFHGFLPILFFPHIGLSPSIWTEILINIHQYTSASSLLMRFA